MSFGQSDPSPRRGPVGGATKLWGHADPSITAVRVYVDETKPDKGTDWQYIGIVIVEEQDLTELGAQLLDDRRSWDGELHFKELSQQHKVEVANRWLSRAMYPNAPLVRWHVLGIDHGRIQRSRFGDTNSTQRGGIYKRFFRSAVSYAVKSLVRGPVIVTQIIHDRADVEHDDTFAWHSIWRMKSDHGLDFSTTRVRFIDSDHRKAEGHALHSQFVQLADLIVSASRQCLDATTTRRYPNEAARTLLPLIERLTNERDCRNPNSRYGHAGRCSLSFFPKHALTIEELGSAFERARRSFYVARRPRMLDAGQGTFFE